MQVRNRTKVYAHPLISIEEKIEKKKSTFHSNRDWTCIVKTEKKLLYNNCTMQTGEYKLRLFWRIHFVECNWLYNFGGPSKLLRRKLFLDSNILSSWKQRMFLSIQYKENSNFHKSICAFACTDRIKCA